MNSFRILFVVLLVVSLIPGVSYAQDDMDLESLLSDLSLDEEQATTTEPATTAEPETTAAPETTTEPPPATEPASAPAADDFADFTADAASDDAALDALMAEEPPAPSAELAVSEQAEPAAPADDFADMFGDDFTTTPEPAVEETAAPATDVAAVDMAAEPTPPPADDFDLNDDFGLGDLGIEEQAPVPEPTPEAVASTKPKKDKRAKKDSKKKDSKPEQEAAPAMPDESFDAGFDDMMAGIEGDGTGDELPMAEVETLDAELSEEAVPETSAEQVAFAAKEEEVRRQALEVEGMNKLKEADDAFDRGDYLAAREAYISALAKIPDRPTRKQDIQRAQWGQADADYKLAMQEFRADPPDLAKADMYIKSTLTLAPDNRVAQNLQAKITKALEREAYLKSLPIPAGKQKVVVERKKTVEELIREGRDFYGIGDYNQAEMLFEQVLLTDEYNVTAMRYLRKIAEKKESISKTAYEATKARAIAKVSETWTPPIKEAVVIPEAMRKGGDSEKETKAEKLRKKMASIIIPKLEFRDGNIQDVIDFLSEASQSGEDGGVNIVLHMPKRGGGAQQASQQDAPADDPFSVWNEEPGTDMAAPAEESIRLTINLRRISLLDAIKTISEITGMRYRIDDNLVVISPQGYVTGQVITRLYPVQPTILDVVVNRDTGEEDRGGDFIGMGGTTTIGPKSDVKDFFERAGVPFPQGTSITYNPGISQLIVANTAENLELFERILAQLNVIPNQVEIEARFIEISENDLREVGLEWILNDNWEIATKKGTGPISSRERIQVDANENGFTEGLRYFSYNNENGSVSPQSAITAGANSALGGILSISSILTNPELSVVLHALDQSGGTDLLSAPRVTARSGFNATIEVVREIIYPTEFDAQSQSVGTGAAESTDRTVVVVTPGSFQTREVGVILNVTPTVGPDGYTIDLAMVPEVSELIGWLEYGSSIGDIAYKMPQPIFSSRNVTTSIVIWDGQTVVMGGLIREELTTTKDKVPLLGDIPLLGRLFRSEGSYSQKKNLLIFVTARLVDPAGKPINKRDATGTVAAPQPAPVEEEDAI